MVAKRKKQYESGEARMYMTRKRALNKLQLTLKDFRRLCILKGIHPREPKNRKRAQKGNLSKIQTLYYKKDIRFLLHEPIVWKFREFKSFLKKIKKASDKGERQTVNRLKKNKPKYSLDHIVKERYPSFIDAIRDLEDCLCLIFLFSTFPANAKTPCEMTSLCKKLSIEFMHYVIEAKALRKVFISIKGYYYQAEILGETVTWIVPHTFSTGQPADVDYRLLSIFTEFYTTLLGFVNFRLFHSLNLKYPPTIPGLATAENDEDSTDRVAALNANLLRAVREEEDPAELEAIPMIDDESSEDKIKEAKEAAKELESLKNLFKNCKVFLNREVPREPLVFVLRSFGARVSWDSTLSPGSTFEASDSGITHHIVDRDTINDKKIGRDYVQPQWVFDCVNQKCLLPVHKYFIGEVLPPHLSPFVSEKRIGDYAPPEEVDLFVGDTLKNDEEAAEASCLDENDEEESDSEEDMERDESEEEKETSLKNMKATVGQAEIEDKSKIKKAMNDEEFKLREMMIKNKHKNLYKSMMKSRKRRMKESNLLSRKRKAIELQAAEVKKS